MSRPDTHSNTGFDGRAEASDVRSTHTGLEDGRELKTFGGSGTLGLDMMRAEAWQEHLKGLNVLVARVEYRDDGSQIVVDAPKEISEAKKAARRLAPQIAAHDYSNLASETRRVLEGVAPEDYTNELDWLQDHLADELELRNPPASVRVKFYYNERSDNLLFDISDKDNPYYGKLITSKRDPYSHRRAE